MPLPARLGLLVMVVMLGACQTTPDSYTPDGQPKSTLNLNDEQRLGEQAYAAGDWSAAMKHYENLVKAIPQDSELWFRLGNIYARSGQPDAAIGAYRETLVRDSENAKAWFNMGVVQLRQAANSFHKMSVHIDSADPIAGQGEEAYTAIMHILDEPQPTAHVAADAPTAHQSTPSGPAANAGYESDDDALE